MEECNQYLIFPEEFIMDMNTVYIKEDFENIKFTYVPDKNRIGAKKKLATFINDLKRSTTENGRLYLDMLVQMFDTENLSVMRIKAFICQLKKRGEALRNTVRYGETAIQIFLTLPSAILCRNIYRKEK